MPRSIIKHREELRQIIFAPTGKVYLRFSNLKNPVLISTSGVVYNTPNIIIKQAEELKNIIFDSDNNTHFQFSRKSDIHKIGKSDLPVSGKININKRFSEVEHFVVKTSGVFVKIHKDNKLYVLNNLLLKGLEFTTDWDDATASDGAFTLAVVSTSTDYDWFIADTFHALGSKTLSIAADESILDGTDKIIKLESEYLGDITTIDWGGKKLTGGIPELAKFTSLSVLKLDINALTGSIPSLIELTSLSNIDLSSNLLSGNTPDLIGLVLLQALQIDNNSLDGTISDISGAIILFTFSCSGNSLTGSIPSFPTSIINVYVYDNSLTGNIPSLTGLTLLKNFWCYDNSLTGYIASTISTTLTNFNASNNALTVTAINQILVDFDAAGHSGGILNLSGGTNGIPSGAGATAKANLIAKGWTVTTN